MTADDPRGRFAQVPESIWRNWPARCRVVCWIVQSSGGVKGVVGMWFGKHETIAAAIGLKPTTVRAALKDAEMAGEIVSRATHIGNGFNGFKVYGVPAAMLVPVDVGFEQLAAKHGLNLKAPGHRDRDDSSRTATADRDDSSRAVRDDSSRAVRDESSRAVRDESSRAMEKTSNSETTKSDTTVNSRSNSAISSVRQSWPALIAQGLEIVGAEPLDRGAATGLGRAFKAYELDNGADAAAAVLIASLQEVHTRRDRSAARIIQETISGSNWADEDEEHYRDRTSWLPDLWTSLLWAKADGSWSLTADDNTDMDDPVEAMIHGEAAAS